MDRLTTRVSVCQVSPINKLSRGVSLAGMIFIQRCSQSCIPVQLFATIGNWASYRHQYSTMVVLRPLHELRTVPWDSSVLDSCDSWTHRCDAPLFRSSTNSRPFILPLPCNRPSQACVCFAIRTTRLLSSDRFGQPITILEKKLSWRPSETYVSCISRNVRVVFFFPQYWRREACFVAMGICVPFARLLSTTCKLQKIALRFATRVHGMGFNRGLACSYSLRAHLIHILALTRRFASRT